MATHLSAALRRRDEGARPFPGDNAVLTSNGERPNRRPLQPPIAPPQGSIGETLLRLLQGKSRSVSELASLLGIQQRAVRGAIDGLRARAYDISNPARCVFALGGRGYDSGVGG